MSLKVFLEMCQEDGVEPRREYSRKFNLRVSPQLHAEIATRAIAEGKSLNQWVADVLDESLYTSQKKARHHWRAFLFGDQD